MKKMKLKVPVNSLISAKQQIKAGADELYATFDPSAFSKLTFSGRSKRGSDGIKTEVDYDEFKEIVKLAHENSVTVEMAANTFRIVEDFDRGNGLQRRYMDYIGKGIDAGADRVIVGDIANIIAVRNSFPDIAITASVFFQTFNTCQVKLLESMGVQKIVLDHCITIPEIEALIKSSNIEFEVFCQFGCSFMHYTCSLFHVAMKNVDLGLPCRATYNIKNTDEYINILDTGEDCGICSLPKLSEIGVSGIKITGRDRDYKLIASITHIYSYVLSCIERNISIQEILGGLSDKYSFEWWKESFCRENRCKYNNTQYHI